MCSRHMGVRLDLKEYLGSEEEGQIRSHGFASRRCKIYIILCMIPAVQDMNLLTHAMFCYN